MIKRIEPALVALFALFSGSGAAAQPAAPLSAERPGFSSSPIALRRGAVQIEGGYQYTQLDEKPDVDAHTLPLALLRVGVVEKLELQLSWAGYSRVDAAGRSADGVTDLSIGVKRQFGDAASAVPIALFAALSVPVGDDEFTSDSVDPTLGLFWTHSGRFDLFGTATIGQSGSDTVITNAVGLALPVDERTGGYVEYVAEFPERGGSSHLLNGGVAWLFRDDLQLDVNLGAGLDDDAPDFFIGGGVAYRF